MMCHSATLQVGMPVNLDYMCRKQYLGDTYPDGPFTVEALGFDWVILRYQGNPYAATFDSSEDSAKFISGVTLIGKGGI